MATSQQPTDPLRHLADVRRRLQAAPARSAAPPAADLAELAPWRGTPAAEPADAAIDFNLPAPTDSDPNDLLGPPGGEPELGQLQPFRRSRPEPAARHELGGLSEADFYRAAADPPPAEQALRSLRDTTTGEDEALRAETEALRAENEELRTLLQELKSLLEEASAHDPEVAAQREQELLRQIAEKDEANRLLHEQLQEIEQHLTTATAPPPREEDLAALSDELERERCQMTQQGRAIEEERRQLREDEESLMKQMREMEVQMAKERAELARQRNEIQRLHAEVHHEMEQLQRGDGVLSAQMAKFQRRHTEILARQGPTSGSAATPAPPVATAAPATPPPRRDSGFMRKFFGSGQ